MIGLENGIILIFEIKDNNSFTIFDEFKYSIFLLNDIFNNGNKLKNFNFCFSEKNRNNELFFKINPILENSDTFFLYNILVSGEKSFTCNTISLDFDYKFKFGPENFFKKILFMKKYDFNQIIFSYYLFENIFLIINENSEFLFFNTKNNSIIQTNKVFLENNENLNNLEIKIKEHIFNSTRKNLQFVFVLNIFSKIQKNNKLILLKFNFEKSNKNIEKCFNFTIDHFKDVNSLKRYSELKIMEFKNLEISYYHFFKNILVLSLFDKLTNSNKIYTIHLMSGEINENIFGIDNRIKKFFKDQFLILEKNTQNLNLELFLGDIFEQNLFTYKELENLTFGLCGESVSKSTIFSDKNLVKKDLLEKILNYFQIQKMENEENIYQELKYILNILKNNYFKENKNILIFGDISENNFFCLKENGKLSNFYPTIKKIKNYSKMIAKINKLKNPLIEDLKTFSKSKNSITDIFILLIETFNINLNFAQNLTLAILKEKNKKHYHDIFYYINKLVEIQFSKTNTKLFSKLLTIILVNKNKVKNFINNFLQELQDEKKTNLIFEIFYNKNNDKKNLCESIIKNLSSQFIIANKSEFDYIFIFCIIKNICEKYKMINIFDENLKNLYYNEIRFLNKKLFVHNVLNSLLNLNFEYNKNSNQFLNDNKELYISQDIFINFFPDYNYSTNGYSLISNKNIIKTGIKFIKSYYEKNLTKNKLMMIEQFKYLFNRVI